MENTHNVQNNYISSDHGYNQTKEHNLPKESEDTLSDEDTPSSGLGFTGIYDTSELINPECSDPLICHLFSPQNDGQDISKEYLPKLLSYFKKISTNFNKELTFVYPFERNPNGRITMKKSKPHKVILDPASIELTSLNKGTTGIIWETPIKNYCNKEKMLPYLPCLIFCAMYNFTQDKSQKILSNPSEEALESYFFKIDTPLTLLSDKNYKQYDERIKLIFTCILRFWTAISLCDEANVALCILWAEQQFPLLNKIFLDDELWESKHNNKAIYAPLIFEIKRSYEVAAAKEVETNFKNMKKITQSILSEISLNKTLNENIDMIISKSSNLFTEGSEIAKRYMIFYANCLIETNPASKYFLNFFKPQISAKKLVLYDETDFGNAETSLSINDANFTIQVFQEVEIHTPNYNKPDVSQTNEINFYRYFSFKYSWLFPQEGADNDGNSGLELRLKNINFTKIKGSSPLNLQNPNCPIVISFNKIPKKDRTSRTPNNRGNCLSIKNAYCLSPKVTSYTISKYEYIHTEMEALLFAGLEKIKYCNDNNIDICDIIDDDYNSFPRSEIVVKI